MATSTYTPLANLTLGSAVATVTFSSISQLYRDLIIVANPKSVSGLPSMNMRLNSDTGTNYSQVYMTGDGSGYGSSYGTGTSMSLAGNAPLSSTDGLVATYSIMDYSATDKHKSTLVRASHASYGVEVWAFRWANTSAITTILLYPGSGSFASGSTFALYGVAA